MCSADITAVAKSERVALCPLFCPTETGIHNPRSQDLGGTGWVFITNRPYRKHGLLKKAWSKMSQNLSYDILNQHSHFNNFKFILITTFYCLFVKCSVKRDPGCLKCAVQGFCGKLQCSFDCRGQVGLLASGGKGITKSLRTVVSF